MTLNELKADLRTILEGETKSAIDWNRVEELCLGVIRRLNAEPKADYPHDVVYHFLDDADVRQKDDGYAVIQPQRLRQWLDPDG